jgi:hypothetical protein
VSCCEKCWEDAWTICLFSNKTQSECYHELLEERKNNPCSPKEQAGQFWDEKKQIDIRKLVK